MPKEKKINFENISDEQFSKMSEDEKDNIEYSSNLFYNPELDKRVRQMDGKSGIVIIKGDERFKGFE